MGFASSAPRWILLLLLCLPLSTGSLFSGVFGASEGANGDDEARSQDPELAASSVRGVPLRDETAYIGLKFRCDNGERELALEAVNDDYCDCDDGTDEPGSAACSGRTTATFFCANEHHVAEFIPASRVADNICDCCDGADESMGTCENVCEQVGAEHRANVLSQQRERALGLEVKQRYLKEAKSALEGGEAGVDVALAHLEADIERTREEEKEAEERKRSLRDALDKLERAAESRLSEARIEGLQLALLKREELERIVVQLVVDGGTSDALVSLTKAALERTGVNTIQVNVDSGTEPIAAAALVKWVSSDTAASVKYSEGNSENWETRKRTTEESKLLQVEAELEEAEVLLEEIREKIRGLEKSIKVKNEAAKRDFGPGGVWWSLQDKCFSVKADGYTYEMCIYGKAKQDHTNLGTWAGFEEGSGYTKALFTNGQKCWNGPMRTLTVHLKCGSEERLDDVREPQTCEYQASFYTPAACT
mmetsp:Transcript_1190/g.1866  ORF Transcript_1190/g.1866 Transcript_1190/m.1866 type:complete len:480 (+) Transcript_1190:60-1499(+)